MTKDDIPEKGKQINFERIETRRRIDASSSGMHWILVILMLAGLIAILLFQERCGAATAQFFEFMNAPGSEQKDPHVKPQNRRFSDEKTSKQ